MYLNWAITIIFLLIDFCLQSDPEIQVKLAKKSSDDPSYVDFHQISVHLRNERNKLDNFTHLQPKPFYGPQILQNILNECSIYQDSKYYYRFCMFANVTQHEKSRYIYHSFHAILGFWNKWFVHQNRFSFMVFDNGDRCQDGLSRRTIVHLNCSPADDLYDLIKVVNVTEIKQCIYSMTIQSSLFCDLGTVYSHLDSIGKLEWDLIQTMFLRQEMSQIDYENYLDSILNNYGLTLLKENQTMEQILDMKDIENNYPLKNRQHEELQRCKQELESLKKKLAQHLDD